MDLPGLDQAAFLKIKSRNQVRENPVRDAMLASKRVNIFLYDDERGG